MSSKEMRVNKSKGAQESVLVPRLRFPKFRDSEGWEIAQLSQVLASISNGLSLNQINDVTDFKVTRIETIADQTIDIQRVGFVIPEDDISQYKLRVGDILFSNINSVAHIGKSVFVDRDYDLYHGMNLLRLSVDEADHVAKFVFYEINTVPVRVSFRTRANKAVNQASINQTEVGRTVVVKPSRDEQQKIADCLSSIDELIDVETRKLAAFNAHKSDLMRQLFPSEGEAIPSHRFAAFQGARAWRSAPIGEIFETASGGTPDRSKKEYWSGHIPWVSTALVNFNHILKAEEFITEEGLKNSSAKIFQQGTILIAMYGQGKTRGKVAILDISATTNQACAAILPKEGIDPEFVFLTLSNRYEELRALSNSGGQENLSQTLIRSFSVSIPWDIEEQMKIKSCLSHLNELIAEQAHRIEALTQHKAGLMQQLFPVMDEAQA